MYVKDPDAVLDWKWDWSDWLATSETITSWTVTPDTGVTVDSSAITDTSTSVTAWLSGGTAGNKYRVACLITTSAGRTDERSITIKVQPR